MIADTPKGFRQSSGSSLLVPEEVSREREVWCRDEWKLLDRTTKLLGARGLQMFLGCKDPRCKEAPIERIRTPDGGFILRCAHKDRILTRHI